MPGRWDTSMKRLVGENPKHFINWLLPQAQFQGKAETRTPNLNTGEIEADNLFRIVLYGVLCLVHIEFQSSSDNDMSRRMWEYNALATFTYKLPTLSFVIYLRKCTLPTPSYTWIFPTGDKVHAFWFKVIDLWNIAPEAIKQTELVGIFPLLVLTKGGKRPEVVEEVITRIAAVGGKSSAELLSLTYLISSLVFEREADRIWLKRRFGMLRDILHDTWAYQEIMQEGRQEGLQLGLQEGRQEGVLEERQQRLKDQRQMLMTIVRLHFPQMASLAQEHAEGITDPEVLQGMVLQLLVAQNEDQVKNILLSSQ
jgi:predicted transposase YdaD